MNDTSNTLRRGFTLIEAMVTVTLMAAVATIALPLLQDDSALRLQAASAVVTSDIEYAQVLSIAQPNAPIVIRFDPDRGRYWLAEAETPDTPLLRDDTGQPYLVEFGVGRARTAEGVTINTVGIPNDALEFDIHGGLRDFTLTPQVELVFGSDRIILSVAATTGSITEKSD